MDLQKSFRIKASTISSLMKYFAAMALMSVALGVNAEGVPVVGSPLPPGLSGKISKPIDPTIQRDPKNTIHYVPPVGDPMEVKESHDSGSSFRPPVGDPGAPEWEFENWLRQHHDHYHYDPRDPLYVFDPHAMTDEEFQNQLKWKKIIAADVADQCVPAAPQCTDDEESRKREDAEYKKDKERQDHEREVQLENERKEAKRQEDLRRAQEQQAREDEEAHARERKSLKINWDSAKDDADRMARQAEADKQKARDAQAAADKQKRDADLLRKAAEEKDANEAHKEFKASAREADGKASRSRREKADSSWIQSQARADEYQRKAEKADRDLRSANERARQAQENLRKNDEQKAEAERRKNFYTKQAEGEALGQGHRDKIIAIASAVSDAAGGLLLINGTYRSPPNKDEYPLSDIGVTDHKHSSIGHAAGAVDISLANFSDERARAILRRTVDQLGQGYFGLYEEVLDEMTPEGRKRVQYNTYFYPGIPPTSRTPMDKQHAEGTHLHIAPCLVANHCPKPPKPLQVHPK